MNLNKHRDFFDPNNQIHAPIHIIGCGAIGSTVAEMLARLGVEKLHLYDFDKVSEHNITNQMFTQKDVGEEKVVALGHMLREINPAIKLTFNRTGWQPDDPLMGHIFLCVDNIDLRRQIAEENKYNLNVKTMWDYRMRLTDAQHYGVDWENPKEIENFMKTMNFTHEEALKETPVSACNTTLSVTPVPRAIVSLGVANFLNHLKGKQIKKLIMIDAFNFTIDAF
jgi:prephenate dehydrogenase